MDVRAPLDEAVVSNGHWDEEDFFVGHGEGSFDHHVEQPELGGEQFPGARAPPLQEELDRVPLADETANVGADHRSVETIAAELAPNEETSAAAKHQAERKERQVVA